MFRPFRPTQKVKSYIDQRKFL